MKKLMYLLSIVFLVVGIFSSCNKKVKEKTKSEISQAKQQMQMQNAFESVYFSESYKLREQVVLEAVRLKESGAAPIYAYWIPKGENVNYSCGGSVLTGSLKKEVFGIKTKNFTQTKNGKLGVPSIQTRQIELKVIRPKNTMTHAQVEPLVLASELSLYNGSDVVQTLGHFYWYEEEDVFTLNPKIKWVVVFDGYLYLIGQESQIYKSRYDSMLDRGETPDSRVKFRPTKL